jgi:hypothetical protein
MTFAILAASLPFGECMGSDRLLLSQSVLSQEQLAALGCLAFEAAHLESFIDSIIQDICGFDDARQTLFVGAWMLDKKVETLKSLLKPFTEETEHAQDLARIYADIKHLNTQRNTSVHGSWQFVSGVAHPIASRNGRGSIVNAIDLMKIALGLSQAVVDLTDLCLRCFYARLPLQRKSSAPPPEKILKGSEPHSRTKSKRPRQPKPSPAK